jgi:cyclophilin family peptidyl-prolyl cis-trans isomerase
VGLRRVSKEWSSPALIISLTDRPELDGRRMIIGELISDIEVVDEISRRRLTPTKAEKNRPLAPVQILDGRMECRAASAADAQRE